MLPRYEFELRTDSGAFESLEQEWNRLFSKADRPYFSQSFAWNRCAWKSFAELRKNRLHCLLARNHGQAILIWPWIIIRDRLWLVARPLYSGAGDYSTVLLDPASEDSNLLSLAFQHLCKTCGCDVIIMPYVRQDSRLISFMANEGAEISLVNPSPYVTFEDYAGWNDYYNSLSGNFRSTQNRKRRRLSERGKLTFDVLTDGQEYRDVVRWLLMHKRKWLAMKGRNYSYVFSARYENFLRSIASYKEGAGRIIVFALKLDGIVVAAELSSVDSSRVEWLIGAFDPAFGQFSPGSILKEHCLCWAFEQGRIYDLRMGKDEYKKIWANRTCDIYRCELVKSAWGAVYSRLRKVALYGLTVERELIRHAFAARLSHTIRQ